jgi:hypothetical protein
MNGNVKVDLTLYQLTVNCRLEDSEIVDMNGNVIANL